MALLLASKIEGVALHSFLSSLIIAWHVLCVIETQYGLQSFWIHGLTCKHEQDAIEDIFSTNSFCMVAILTETFFSRIYKYSVLHKFPKIAKLKASFSRFQIFASKIKTKSDFIQVKWLKNISWGLVHMDSGHPSQTPKTQLK